MNNEHVEKIRQDFTESAFWNFIGLEIEALDEGHVILHLPYQKAFDNVRNTIHGGIYMSVIDTTMGMFCRSLGFDDVVTIQMNTQFLQSVIEGDLSCTASLISQSRSTVLVEGKLFNDQEEMVGYSTATFKVTKYTA